MIVLAIIATVVALLVSFVVVMANGMSDSPATPFQGGLLIGVAWISAAVLWLAWWVG